MSAQAWLRALLVWLVLISVEIAHGTLRAIFLVPIVGDFRSRQLGVFSGSALIFAVAFFFVRWIRAGTTRDWISVGVFWLALTLAFEIGIGRLFRSWDDLLLDYRIDQGGLLPFGLLFLAAAPYLASRLRKRER